MRTTALMSPHRVKNQMRPLHLVPLVLALAVSQAYGATTGTPGTRGSNGVGPGAAGTSGGNGGDAAEQGQNGYARAEGGYGGSGGNGGPAGGTGRGGAAGSGGNGGNASASATDAAGPAYWGIAEASGGSGGNSGEPGAYYSPNLTGAPGNRGRGGDASALLSLTSAPRQPITVTAKGGNGGSGSGTNLDAVGGTAHAGTTLAASGPLRGTISAKGGTGASGAYYSWDGSGAGHGAAGGAASLTLDTRSTDIDVEASSRGGTGGFAKGAGYRAGDGAGATGTLTGSVGTRLKTYLSVGGGTGGEGVQGADGGNGAAITLRNPVALAITTGALDLSVYGLGGAGGDSANGAAGRGGAADVSQVLDTRQASSVKLRLGAGGASAGTATGDSRQQNQGSVQAGADGRADLRLTGRGPVSLEVSASGGNGGGVAAYVSYPSLLDGKRGGDARATSEATVATDQASTSSVSVRGGNGGSVGGLDKRGGDGGSGFANGNLHNSGTGMVSLEVKATAGEGGNGGSYGGSGGSTTLVNALSASTGGKLVLAQHAVGGNGGTAVNGGNGGNAVSRLTLADGRSTGITATVSATGGTAGRVKYGTTGGVYGLGGSAEALLDLTSTAAGADVNGTAAATGGYGNDESGLRDSGSALARSKVQGLGNAVSKASAVSPGGALARHANVDAYAGAVGVTGASATAMGSTGNAFENVARSQAEARSASGSVNALSTALGYEVHSVATARNDGAGTNVAIANAEGLRGSARAQSTSATANGVLVSTSVDADVQGDTQARTEANVGGAAYALVRPVSSSGGRSYASALPDRASVDTLLAATPEVAAAMMNSDIVGFGVMQGSRAPALSYDTTSYVTAANFQFDTTGERYLTLGLLGSLAQGTGLRELELTVSNHGTELFSQTFTSLADAQLFFGDNALNLGLLGAGSQDLLVSAGFTYTGPGGYSFQYALGIAAVPEPQTWMLMLLGLTVVLVRRKARG
jgi:hypothetical protein